MRKLLVLAVLVFALCALAPAAGAEVTLSDYRALTMLTDTHYGWEYMARLYELRFKQYGQPITSSGVLNPDAVANDRALNVPSAGDVLVVYVNNRTFASPDSDTAYFYYDTDDGFRYVSMNKVASALSAFPGKVVVVISSRVQEGSTGTKETALARASVAFPESKFTLLALFQDATGGAGPLLFQGLGYKVDYNCPPLDHAYADANGDGIITAGELYAYVQAPIAGYTASLFRGQDLPVFYCTNRQKLEMVEGSHTLVGQESFKVGLVIEPAGATGFMEWSSSNKKVATVDASGVVTGVAPGKADIILKADGKTLKLPVTVKKLEAASLSIVPPAKDVYVYDYVTLAVQTEPAGATEKIISWTSSNKKVATITKNGLVHALHDGRTVITVKTKRFPKVQYALTVKKIPVTRILIIDHDYETSFSIQGGAGASRSFEAEALPHNASFRGVKWVSDRPSVAKVSASGTIQFVKPGSAIVRAVAVDDPSIYTEIKVTVVENQRAWSAPNPVDYADKEARLYVLPKRLYYAGSKLMGEVYVFNHTASSVKSISAFRACLIDTYYYETYQSEPQCILASKYVKSYAFTAPIPPEGTGVYRFPIAYKKKIDIPFIRNRAPMLFRKFPNF